MKMLRLSVVVLSAVLLVIISAGSRSATGQMMPMGTGNSFIAALEMGNEVADPAAADWRLDQAVAAGAGWVRIYVPWAVVEQQQGVFTWKGTTPPYLPPMNFDLDYEMAAIRSRGLRAIAIIQYTPDWARIGGDVYTPPNDPRAYANFVKEVIKRYADVVRVVEIWNEVDLDEIFLKTIPPGAPKPPTPFWRGSVPQYVSILNAAYEVVKATDPSVIVCSSGLAALNQSFLSDWLETFFSNQPRPQFDWFGWHPYGLVDGAGPDANNWTTNSFRGFNLIANLLDAKGYTNAPILLTEFGYRYDAGIAEDQIADMLPEAYAVAFSSSRIKGLNWFSVKYHGGDGDFGLYDDFGRQRISFKAFQTFNALTAGYHFDIREQGTDNGTEPQVYRFCKDGKRIWMVYAPYVPLGYSVIEPQPVTIHALPYETLNVVNRDGLQSRITADASGAITVPATRNPLYLVEP